MKRLTALLTILACFSVNAVDEIQVDITVTNAAVTGNTITINGVTRTWTNAHSATTILTNLAAIGINNTASNLNANIGQLHPLGFPIPTFKWLDTNKFRMTFAPGYPGVVTSAGNWAVITNLTIVLAPMLPVRVPVTSEPSSSNRVHIASRVIELAELSTNYFKPGWTAFTYLVGTTNAQVISGVKQIIDPGLLRPSITNAVWISGVMGPVTNGYWTNAILGSPIMTNAQNFGTAFRSPGAGSVSDQFGSGAVASGDESFAAGPLSEASGFASTAVGSGAIASGGASFAGGASTGALETNTVAIGSGAGAQAPGSTALGAFVDVAATHTNSMGLGADTTDKQQIMAGSSSHTVVVPGVLSVTGTQTNTVFSGTNRFDLAVSLTRSNNTTLANGVNLLDPGFKTYVKVSGPSAGYSIDKITRGWSGRILVIQKSDSFTLTIANESGSGGGSDTDRILTGTGGNVTTTNNPAALMLIYDDAAGRWVLMNHNPGA